MTDSKTAERKKLSVIPRGHWRNKWQAPWNGVGNISGRVYLKGETYYGVAQYISAEMAEQAYEKARPTIAVYLGPVFFPDP